MGRGGRARGADFDLAAPNGGDQGISADSPGLVLAAHAWPVLAQQCGWCEVKANTLTLTRRGEEMLSRGNMLTTFERGFTGLLRTTNSMN